MIMKLKSLIILILFCKYCLGQSVYYQTIESLDTIKRDESTNYADSKMKNNNGFNPLNFGSFNQTNVFGGITKFAIDQFKSDLVDGFLHRFQKYINEYGELGILFQETLSQLNNIKEVSSSELGNQFRAAFYKDLYLFPSRLAKYMENPSDTTNTNFKFLTMQNIRIFKASTDYPTFQISLKLFEYLLNYYHPQNSIEMLDATINHDSIKSKDDKISMSSIIHLLNIVQSAFREKSDVYNGQVENVWITFEQLKRINTPAGIETFVKLVYYQDTNLFKYVININDSEQRNSFFKKSLRILEICQSLQEFARQSNQEKKNFIAYVNLFSNLISASEAFFNSTDPNIFNVLNKVGSIYTSIHDGSFNLLFTNLIDLVNLLYPDAYKSEGWIKMQRLLNKYISFSIALVNSKNAEEVKEVINSHVKVNANRALKRNSAYGLTLNVNPGFIAAVESQNHRKPRYNFGFTLPIGFDFYFNWPGKKVNSQRPSNKNLYYAHGSPRIPSRNYTSITFSVIDLGAFLTYGISGKPWDSIPNKKINVLNVMSPGISINQSIAGFPITIGIAYRYTPELRKLQEDLYPRRHQFNLNLMWDIPIVSIFNKSYNIKKFN